jgi:hypothetical protein
VSAALDLNVLSLAEKDALILAQAEQRTVQAAQITALQAQIAALEAKLGQPPKTPDNSSLPPSKGGSRTGRSGAPNGGIATPGWRGR